MLVCWLLGHNRMATASGSIHATVCSMRPHTQPEQVKRTFVTAATLAEASVHMLLCLCTFVQQLTASEALHRRGLLGFPC
jgi:hypothetical protein